MAKILPMDPVQEPRQLLALGWQLPRALGSLTSAPPSSQTEDTLQADPREIPKGCEDHSGGFRTMLLQSQGADLTGPSEFSRSHLPSKRA